MSSPAGTSVLAAAAAGAHALLGYAGLHVGDRVERNPLVEPIPPHERGIRNLLVDHPRDHGAQRLGPLLGIGRVDPVDDRLIIRRQERHDATLTQSYDTSPDVSPDPHSRRRRVLPP